MHLPYFIFILFFVIHSRNVDGKFFSMDGDATNEAADNILADGKSRAKRDTIVYRKTLNGMVGGCRNVLVMTYLKNQAKLRLPVGNEFEHAQMVLHNWNMDRSSRHSRVSTTEQTYKQVQLDRLVNFQRDGVEYDDFQLQTNGTNPSTIAHLTIQREIQGYEGMVLKQLIVYGLRSSLNRGAEVVIKLRLENQNGAISSAAECQRIASRRNNRLR